MATCTIGRLSIVNIYSRVPQSDLSSWVTWLIVKSSSFGSHRHDNQMFSFVYDVRPFGLLSNHMSLTTNWISPFDWHPIRFFPLSHMTEIQSDLSIESHDWNPIRSFLWVTWLTANQTPPFESCVTAWGPDQYNFTSSSERTIGSHTLLFTSLGQSAGEVILLQ